MTDADRATVAIVTGILGSVTGTLGFILAIVSFRRSQKIKALDLRLELRKRHAEVFAAAEALAPKISKAKESRVAVLSATGGIRSGSFEAWKVGIERDLASAREIRGRVPPQVPADQSDHAKLEQQLVDLHALALQINQLRSKYDGELAADEKSRDQIRESATRRLH